MTTRVKLASPLLEDKIHIFAPPCNILYILIKVKLSKQDPLYMARLVKHLCKIRNKSIRKGDNEQLHNRINTLIRDIMVTA